MRILGMNTWDLALELMNFDWCLFNSIHEVRKEWEDQVNASAILTANSFRRIFMGVTRFLKDGDIVMLGSHGPKRYLGSFNISKDWPSAWKIRIRNHTLFAPSSKCLCNVVKACHIFICIIHICVCNIYELVMGWKSHFAFDTFDFYILIFLMTFTLVIQESYLTLCI